MRADQREGTPPGNREPRTPARAEERFVALREGDWLALSDLLERKRSLHQLRASEISHVGRLYRSVCTDAMRARASGFSRELISYLDGLAGQAHNALYGARPYPIGTIVRLLTHGFPAMVREQRWPMLISTLLFTLPLVFGLVMSLEDSSFASAVLTREMLQQMVDNYADAHHGRAPTLNAFMTAHYIENNVSIAFRCFATGIFFTIGSVFFLIYNGLAIGTVMGGVISAGHGRNILTFVCGHGAFELTAIVISGAAGLRMGWSLVETHGRSRLRSLQAQGHAIATLIGGAAIMLLTAAFIEGFWSPSAVPDPVKWGVAGGLWFGVLAYFVFAGRSDRWAS